MVHLNEKMKGGQFQAIALCDTTMAIIYPEALEMLLGSFQETSSAIVPTIMKANQQTKKPK